MLCSVVKHTGSGAVGQRNAQEGEGQEQNSEKENEAHPNDKHNPEIISPHGANFDDDNTTTTQKIPVSSNTSNSTSKKTQVQQSWEGENPVHDETSENDSLQSWQLALVYLTWERTNTAQMTAQTQMIMTEKRTYSVKDQRKRNRAVEYDIWN